MNERTRFLVTYTCLLVNRAPIPASLYAIDPCVLYPNSVPLSHAAFEHNTPIEHSVKPAFLDKVDKDRCLNFSSIQNTIKSINRKSPILSSVIESSEITDRNMEKCVIYYFTRIEPYLQTKDYRGWRRIVEEIHKNDELHKAMADFIFGCKNLNHTHYSKLFDGIVTSDSVRKFLKNEVEPQRRFEKNVDFWDHFCTEKGLPDCYTVMNLLEKNCDNDSAHEILRRFKIYFRENIYEENSMKAKMDDFLRSIQMCNIENIIITETNDNEGK